MIRLVGYLTLMLVGCATFAAPAPVKLDVEQGRYVLGKQVEYLEDPAGKLTLSDVTAPAFASRWQPSPAESISFGYTDSVYWFSFSLQGSARNEWLLEIDYALLDYIELFAFTKDAEPQRIKTGDHMPSSQRPIFHRNFVLPIRLGVDGAAKVYLRVQTTTTMRVPLILWQERALYRADQKALMVEAIYYGIMIAMLLYNLFIFFVIRDRGYLYYVGTMTFIVIFVSSFRGVLYQFLWSDSMPLWWNDRIPPLAGALASLLVCLFTSTFLELRQKYPVWWKLFVVMSFTMAAAIVSVLALPYAIAIRTVTLLAIFTDLSALAVGYYTWWRGQPSASYFAIAWTALLVGAIALALNLLGFIPNNFWTDRSLQVGSALDAILLSFALAHRLRQATYQAAHDPLTGLVNRREFERRVREALGQTTSGERRHALLYIDLDQFKSVNDALGHAAGDELLREITQLLQGRLRESDTLARLGGDEFAVLLTNCPPEQAERIAANLLDAVAEFKFTWQERTFSVGASIGLVRFTSGEQTVTGLLNAADSACYMAKEKGRNRVQIHGATA